MRIGRLIEFSVVILLLLGTNSSFAQKALPVLRASGPALSMRIDTEFFLNRWNIDPKLKPDVSKIPVPIGKAVRVAFVAAKDSLVRTVRAGDRIDFIVLTTGGDSALTQIRGIAFTEAAVFSKEYVKTHTGKTFVEIPDVYELINTVFALTKAAQKNSDLVNKNTPYYQKVVDYFSSYKNEPVVSVIDSILTSDDNTYFPLKMDAYAFSFDRKGVIQQSPVYDRVSWGSENTLRPYVPLLQQFAEKSKFIDFYRKNQPYYTQLITAYRDSLDVAGMQTWLNLNFPSTRYNSFKILFSPLVSGNQSAKWFDNNGFREAQAHVNFPFRDKSDLNLSAKAVRVRDGNIVFTELNHAFINPEAEKPPYQKALTSAFVQLDIWIDTRKPAKNYNNVYSCFEEYMNWGLVSLRYVDYAPKNELPNLLSGVETMMVNRRGFKRFAEFNQFLVLLYQNRPSGTTVADLYPQIIHWFEANKQQN